MPTPDPNSPFCKALRRAIADAGINQTELADAVGATQSMVSTWVNGKYVPKPPTVDQIEQHLNLRPAELSRYLGSLTASYDDGSIPSVQRAVEADEWINDEAKAAVIALYRHFRRAAH